MRSEARLTGSPAGRPRPDRTGRRRPEPMRPLDVREWRALAACRGVATLFYKNDLDSEELTRHRVTKAKALCARCPVRPQCAAHALAMAEPFGIWGGFTESDRTLLRKIDWRQYADSEGTTVDVTQLQARLRAIRGYERSVLPSTA
jgi:WhiB family transcriptional regulator, redox-sensing transcriptional regulator